MPTQNKAVYIVDGIRTPFLKARSQPNLLSASDLAVQAGRELLTRQPFSPTDIGEVILGCVMPSPDEVNIARIVALRLGCGQSVPAWTVQRNCASGMQAIDAGMQDILAGRHELILVGGTEAMSRAPLLFNPDMVNWLSQLWAAKSISAKLKQIMRFRPRHLAPVIALLKGLTDPVVNLSMGQTAENVAYRFHITRAEMDAFALESHQRAAGAIDQHHLTNEVVTVFDSAGRYVDQDDGIRRETSMEKLADLKAFFDKKFGQVTAGNSSQVTDGAALLLLASEEAVKKYQLPVLARVIDTAWVGVDPAEMGLGPVHATVNLLKQYQLKCHDIDYWEINEAFAAQVLGCLAAFENVDYCRDQLGLDQVFGRIDETRLNVDGGAIALGHPVGASGARIMLHLAHVLKREKAHYGVATICIGGGQGGAMLIENQGGFIK